MKGKSFCVQNGNGLNTSIWTSGFTSDHWFLGFLKINIEKIISLTIFKNSLYICNVIYKNYGT